MQGNPTSSGLSNSESAAPGAGKEIRRDGAPNLAQLPSCGDFDIRIPPHATCFYPTARILRPVYYHLVELGAFAEIDGGEQLGVWSAGRFFPLGRISN